jgi:hypothetical protein
MPHEEEQTQDLKSQGRLQDVAYGYQDEEQKKSWLDMIVDYIKSSRESKASKLKEAV